MRVCLGKSVRKVRVEVYGMNKTGVQKGEYIKSRLLSKKEEGNK